MLRFQDDRTARNRANVRSLRRTLLRLTLQLPREQLQLGRRFADILTAESDDVVGVNVASALSYSHANSGGEDTECPYDSPIIAYMTVTRDWLLQICELMLRRGYSLSYIKRSLFLIRADCKGGQFPLTVGELKAFLRSIVASKNKHFADRAKQSDGIYAMSDALYENMRVYCVEYLRAADERGVGVKIVDRSQLAYIAEQPPRPRTILFSYLYLMMYHTGKRCSDVAVLSCDDLRLLLDKGDIAITIPKTERVGRLSMSHIEKAAEFRECVERFLRVCDGMPTAIIPFDAFVLRRSFNAMFQRVYEQMTGEKKPRGLSFHALRRRKAARYFKQGESLETIRECLDHKDARMTNLYINKFLLSEQGKKKSRRTSDDG